MPDPVGMEFTALQKQLEALTERVGRLEEENRRLRENGGSASDKT